VKRIAKNWQGNRPMSSAPDNMKNANVFVDVDLTLVDANNRRLEGAREGLLALKGAGCHLFLWSTAGG